MRATQRRPASFIDLLVVLKKQRERRKGSSNDSNHSVETSKTETKLHKKVNIKSKMLM